MNAEYEIWTKPTLANNPAFMFLTGGVMAYEENPD